MVSAALGQLVTTRRALETLAELVTAGQLNLSPIWRDFRRTVRPPLIGSAPSRVCVNLERAARLRHIGLMMTPTKPATTTAPNAASAAYQARERNDALRAFILSPEALKPVDRPAFRVDWSNWASDRYKEWVADMAKFNKSEARRVAAGLPAGVPVAAAPAVDEIVAAADGSAPPRRRRKLSLMPA